MTERNSPNPMMAVILIAIMVIVLPLGIYLKVATARREKVEKVKQDSVVAAYAAAHPATAPMAQPEMPEKVRAETPATITADYGYSLEADGPIMVQYPGEKPFLFDPKGKECQQLPEPRDVGPKKFWDPKDPTNGHIGFRIYRGGNGRC